MNMAPTEVTLTLPSREQARVVMKALELFARLNIGQLEQIESMVRHGEVPLGPNGHPGADLEAFDAVGAAMRHAKVAMGYTPNGSYSIVSDEAPLAARRAWETFKVISQALGEGCGRDGLQLRCTEDLAPTAAIEPSSAT